MVFSKKKYSGGQNFLNQNVFTDSYIPSGFQDSPAPGRLKLRKPLQNKPDPIAIGCNGKPTAQRGLVMKSGNKTP